MSVRWQRLRVPLLERLALLDIAERRGETEENALARIIRDAVKRECVRLAEDQEEEGQTEPQEEAQP